MDFGSFDLWLSNGTRRAVDGEAGEKACFLGEGDGSGVRLCSDGVEELNGEFFLSLCQLFGQRSEDYKVTVNTLAMPFS